MSATDTYASRDDSVSHIAELLPSPQSVVLGTGIGRLAIGAGFLAAPVLSTRVLGLDTATAKRITFLARMAAVRDITLGVGTLTAGPDAGRWLAAGAVCDLVDAVVIVAAVRKRTLRGALAAGIAVGAVASAVVGLRAAAALRRG